MMYSSGVLLYTVKNDQVYFLLGKDRQDGSYSDFGGRSEDQDGGDPRATACREFYEETAGAVLDLDSIEARLVDRKCHLEIQSRTMGNSLYYQYVVYIPYMANYTSNFMKTVKFLRYIKCHRRYMEKSEIAWFSYADVIAAAEGRTRGGMDGGSHLPLVLRDVFAATIRLARPQLENIKETLNCYPSSKSYVGNSPPK